MTKASRNTRLDWLTFALEVLVEKGPEHLKVASLCELKKVSKGSFYHHFANRAAFIDALMAHWYESRTLHFIEQANRQVSPLARLQALDTIIAANEIEAEMHIRAWALKEPSIASHLEKIDSQRQGYLAEAYIELGLNQASAQDLAMMTYANFLGLQQLHPRPSMAQVVRVTSLASKALLNLTPEHST